MYDRIMTPIKSSVEPVYEGLKMIDHAINHLYMSDEHADIAARILLMRARNAVKIDLNTSYGKFGQ